MGVILDEGADRNLLKTPVQLRASEAIRHREDAAGGPRVPKPSAVRVSLVGAGDLVENFFGLFGGEALDLVRVVH
ncbi:MAG: hypothetical protein QOJ99_108 [Bryobacterales bacterium]|jgi:hypothetical protein|nr:hypothetical protein [Bryobacterales bacterium]